MEFLKRYGSILVYAAVGLLILINFNILTSANKSITEDRIVLAEAKSDYQAAKDELKDVEKELQSERKKDKELSKQIDEMVSDSEKYKKEQDKLQSEAALLVKEKQELLKDNYRNYNFDHSIKITEDLIIDALSIVQKRKIKSGEYEWKVDISDYQVATMYKKDEFYMFYAFDHFVAVFSLTENVEMKHIYITDIKNNKIVADKSYDLPYLE